jgi:hypothetical protein
MPPDLNLGGTMKKTPLIIIGFFLLFAIFVGIALVETGTEDVSDTAHSPVWFMFGYPVLFLLVLGGILYLVVRKRRK